MSDFGAHARNNAKFNQEQLYPGQTNARNAQINSRNASTFNPIAFNPEASAFVDDEKQRKKDKQRQYRDQLDQMVHGTSGTSKVPSGKTTAEVPQQHYQQQQQYQQQYDHQFDPVREKRDLEQRYMQANIEEQQRKQQPIDAPYGNDYGRYPAPQQGYDNVSSGTYARRGESPSQTQSRKLSQREPVIVDRNEPASTFNQQDDIRDQLLAKIRSGNKQPNNYVYGTYQMAHEDREKSRRDFERNVIDKAAQEKLMKEDQRASSQWEQKKRLERETYLANQQAIQSKSQQKKRSQQAELFADQGRIKDSLEQFERQDLDSKFRKKKLMEENSKVLQQQRYDYQSRNTKQGDDQDIRTSGHYSQAELSPNKVPSNQYPSYGGGYQGESQQRAPLVSRPGADNWDQGDLASKMEGLNMKEQYGGGYPSYQQEDYSQKYALDQGAGAQGYARQDDYSQGAQGYAKQDDYAQKYYQEQPAYQPKDDYGYEARGKAQEPKHNPTVEGNAGARADYLRIRDKVRYGNNFNIISNELR